MIDRREKNALIAEIYENSSLQGFKILVKLLNELINEARSNNDTAEGNEVSRNQGEIRGYRKLLDYITKGLPPKTESNGINLT